MPEPPIATIVRASSAALAWLNAFLAVSNNADRAVLYRALSIEFFPSGIQLIGCDGTLLFRTWAPCNEEPMPLIEEEPERSIVVLDHDKFAHAFMRTMVAATKNLTYEPLLVAVEAAPTSEDEAPLGEAFVPDVLTLSALGQQLHCKLYEGIYPDWRRLQFGVDRAELVEGMLLATRMFSTVGKLKGVNRVECEFHGENRQIAIHGLGDVEMRGLLMPMRRVDEKATPSTEPTDAPEAPEE